MDFNKQLIIGYSGSLDAYVPSNKKNWIKKMISFFWTYKHDTVNSSTRSGYYLIKAIEKLQSTKNLKPEQLKVCLWGKINTLNEVQIKAANLEDFFEVSGYLSKEESLNKLNNSDLLFLPLEKSNTESFGTLFIPGKLFEYLNTGKPILALCEHSDCKDILERSGLGICVEPDNINAIAGKIWELVNDRNVIVSLRSDRAYIDGFSFRNKSKELADVFDSLSVK